MSEFLQRKSLSTRQQLRWVFYLFLLVTAIEVCNILTGRVLNQFGLVPRHIATWPGVFIGPWLHGSIWHFFSNIVPLCIFTLLMLQHGTGRFIFITLWIIIFTGITVWLFGRQAVHIGASGLVYGYFGYLLLAGFLSGRPKLILIAILVGFFYGGIIWGVFPGRPYISWESHLFGFIGGLIGAFYHSKR